MALESLVARLGKVIGTLVAGGIAYGCTGVVLALLSGVELVPGQGFPWPDAMPAWPSVMLLGTALVVAGVEASLLVMLRARKRKHAERSRALADEWLRGPVAAVARESGLVPLRPGAFRAHARGSHHVALSWNPPPDNVDEVVVFRSPLVFATSVEPADGQVAIYSGDEAACEDWGLGDDCVYHYAAFARSREGGWSPPAWAWAMTPALPLHSRFMRTLRMDRALTPGSLR